LVHPLGGNETGGGGGKKSIVERGNLGEKNIIPRKGKEVINFRMSSAGGGKDDKPNYRGDGQLG